MLGTYLVVVGVFSAIQGYRPSLEVGVMAFAVVSTTYGVMISGLRGGEV